MREKLIELMRKAVIHVKEGCDSQEYCDECPYRKFHPICLGVAWGDYLIANGVTIPVRCKDCKNRDEITGECKHPKAVGWDVLIPDDDDFCSCGERRTDDG